MSSDKPAKSSRVLTFDLLRGYFLLSIIINHLNYVSPASWLTMRGELFVSSAEGFFLISGIVLGIVRGAKLVGQPFKHVARLLLKRAVQLYIVYVIGAVLFTLIGWWFFMDNPGLKPGIAAADTPFYQMIWDIASFSYLYGWLDYLRLYIFFLLASPLAVWLLRRGLWWVVLSISAIIWQFAPELARPDSVYTQPYNWQILFFGGLTIGFHWKQITAWWGRIAKSVRTFATTILLSTALVTLLLNIFIAFGGYYGTDIYNIVAPIRDMLHPYFDKENLPIARLAMFFVWFWAAFWLFKKFERHIVKAIGWLLLPFGSNSLYVYIMHGVFVFFVHLFIPRQGQLINLLVVSGIFAAIWLMIRYKVLMKIIPR